MSTATQGRRRRDVVRNERRLIDATGEVIRELDPREITVGKIAERAGLSLATAYRYHSSVDAMMNAYLCEVIFRLRELSDGSAESGAALFDAVLAEWGRLVEIYGPAMVLMRSRRGFLERLRAGDHLIGTVRAAWERPIRGLLAARGLDAGLFEDALFPYNIVFDPREILDLRAADIELPDVLHRLSAAYIAAVEGWSQAQPSQ